MIKNRIKEYRVRFDMKQEELASKVGVRRETIGNLVTLIGTRMEYSESLWSFNRRNIYS